MSLTIDSIALTPNPVDARGSLTISAAVTEVPDTPSAELLVWLDPTQSANLSLLENMAPNLISEGMHLNGFADTPDSGLLRDALRFDGVDDRGTIYFDSYDELTDWTIELLLRKEDIYQGFNEPILDIKTGNNVLGLLHYTSGGLSFEGTYYSFAYMSNHTPMHVCITRAAGENSATVYINGQYQEYSWMGNGDDGRIILGYPLFVGMNNRATSYAAFDLMGLRIYRGVLNADEVRQKYEEGMRAPALPASKLTRWYDSSKGMTRGDMRDQVSKASWYSLTVFGGSIVNNVLGLNGADAYGVLMPGTTIADEGVENWSIELKFSLSDIQADSSGVVFSFKTLTGAVVLSHTANRLQYHGADIAVAQGNAPITVCITRSAALKRQWVYINGILETRIQEEPEEDSAIDKVNAQIMTLGAGCTDFSDFQSATDFTSMGFYGLRIYSGVLTAGEVLAQYNAGMIA